MKRDPPQRRSFWIRLKRDISLVGDFLHEVLFGPEYIHTPITTFPTRGNKKTHKMVIPTHLPQETETMTTKKFNSKAKIKALQNCQKILTIHDEIGTGSEDDLMATLKELRKIQIEAKDDSNTNTLVQFFMDYLEGLLRSTYIAAEELLREASERPKTYHGGYNNTSDILYMMDNGITIKGTSGKEYIALTSSTWGNNKVHMTCNMYGFTYKMPDEYADATRLRVALGQGCKASYKGQREVVDGVEFAVIKYFPHIEADRKGKKSLPKDVIQTHSKMNNNGVAPSVTPSVSLPPQNIVGKPLDQVSSQPSKGQQLQPQT